LFTVPGFKFWIGYIWPNVATALISAKVAVALVLFSSVGPCSRSTHRRVLRIMKGFELFY